MGEHLQRLVAAAEANNIPLSVSLEVTARCPLACGHCFVPRNLDELPTATWLDLLDQLAAAGTMFLGLTGGEPFVRDDLLDIAEHARRLGMAVSFLTSGAPALDYDRIAALRPLLIGLSMYSVDAAVHDAITRTPGSHARTLEAAHQLRRRELRVRLAAPILAANADHVAAVADLAEQIGAEVTFDPMTIVGRDGSDHPANARPDAATLARALGAIGDTFEAGTRPADEPTCAAARRVATVLPNGDVLACSLYPEPAGNVTQAPFADIWRSSPVLAHLRELTVASLDPGCATCTKHSYCGRCSALALLEDGALLGPSRAACMLAEARELTEPSHLPARHGMVQVCKE